MSTHPNWYPCSYVATKTRAPLRLTHFIWQKFLWIESHFIRSTEHCSRRQALICSNAEGKSMNSTGNCGILVCHPLGLPITTSNNHYVMTTLPDLLHLHFHDNTQLLVQMDRPSLILFLLSRQKFVSSQRLNQ